SLHRHPKTLNYHNFVPKSSGKEALYTSFPYFIFMNNSLHKEENAAGDFGSVYMILVFAIAALLLVLIVKPMFQSAQKTVQKVK
ncbi:MAG: hypothetical protein WCI04_05660, partial [archaeon]